MGSQREMLQAPSRGHEEGKARFRNSGILDLRKQLAYKAHAKVQASEENEPKNLLKNVFSLLEI